jgi:hypothetical protein
LEPLLEPSAGIAGRKKLLALAAGSVLSASSCDRKIGFASLLAIKFVCADLLPASPAPLFSSDVAPLATAAGNWLRTRETDNKTGRHLAASRQALGRRVGDVALLCTSSWDDD